MGEKAKEILKLQFDKRLRLEFHGKMRFEIVQGDEQLSSHSGLALAGAILDRSSIRKRLDAVVLPEHPFSEISHGEVATAMIGLICVRFSEQIGRRLGANRPP